MNKLLATTAVAMIAFTGAASAQSVLERVLGQIDNASNLASVNGTFANIAENIGTPNTGNTSVIFSVNDDTLVPDLVVGDVLTAEQFAIILADYIADEKALAGPISDEEEAALEVTAEIELLAAFNQTVVVVPSVGLAEGINGSISNVIDGIDAATQTALSGTGVSAIEYNMPTFEFGDMATTALGAVNTGDITLGVNSSVDDAKTSSTQAVSSVMEQLGGSAGTGAIVLNIASNMTGINGSISNDLMEVNGKIGALSTTALGAVNTGTIVSGVDSAVQGIIGMSGAVN
jgi:hypothetical protein